METLDITITVPFVALHAQYESIKHEIDAAMAAVIRQSAYVGGAFVDEFEQSFARYCGARHCIGVANGTDALFIALKSLGIGPGDEVITAANTFVATAEAVRMAGADVVFVDIDPRTFTIDVNRIEEKITRRTKAIIPVHLYGQPADMDPIVALARAHRLWVVGDAAQAHGAQYKGGPVSQFADITSFSFYPGKNLGAYGDAGALVTDNDEWAARARMLGNHGGIRKYEHEVDGVNSRLDGLQAAILTVKLRHLENWTEGRRRNASKYEEALKAVDVVTPARPTDVRTVYHLYVVRVPGRHRDGLQEFLKNCGISTGIHYPTAIPYLKPYRRMGHSEADFPQAFQASQEVISLPMFPELTDDQIQYVADRIRGYGL
jgi:dTDP-4-amino-4,6-dideoxygalactose transaminase